MAEASQEREPAPHPRAVAAVFETAFGGCLRDGPCEGRPSSPAGFLASTEGPGLPPAPRGHRGPPGPTSWPLAAWSTKAGDGSGDSVSLSLNGILGSKPGSGGRGYSCSHSGRSVRLGLPRDPGCSADSAHWVTRGRRGARTPVGERKRRGRAGCRRENARGAGERVAPGAGGAALGGAGVQGGGA